MHTAIAEAAIDDKAKGKGKEKAKEKEKGEKEESKTTEKDRGVTMKDTVVTNVLDKSNPSPKEERKEKASNETQVIFKKILPVPFFLLCRKVDFLVYQDTAHSHPKTTKKRTKRRTKTVGGS